MSYQSPERDDQDPFQRRRRQNLSGVKLRLMIAGAIVLFALVSYYGKGQANPITGQKQRVDLSVRDEIAMGLQNAPSVGRQSIDRPAQNHIDLIGARLINALDSQLAGRGVRNPYPFEFHLLADRQMVNAFALPGGQIFITEGLYRRLSDDGEIAGVLGHEMGHVIERHSSQRLAKGSLIDGIAGAAGVAGGDSSSSQAAAWVGNIVSMKYGREDELESDRWGVKIMVIAGYSPEHLLRVMDVLEQSSGGAGPPEFLSTHPRPANRRAYINEIIMETFPNGIPSGLQ